MSDLYPDFVLSQDNCDREPIHRPEAIQGSGHLLALDGELYDRFAAASDSLAEALGVAVDELHQRPLACLPETVRDARSTLLHGNPAAPSQACRPEAANPEEAGPQLTGPEQGVIRPLGHLELEATAAEGPAMDESLDFDRFVADATDVDTICNATAGFLRNRLGYDRVMVYPFDAAGAPRHGSGPNR